MDLLKVLALGLLCASGIMLGSCSSTGGAPDPAAIIAKLGTFTQADLAQAAADAKAGGDTVAETCFTSLAATAPTDALKQLPGAATVLERARLARLALLAGGPGSTSPCGPFIQQEIAFGIGVAGKLGLTVATGGASGLLGLGMLGL